MINILPGSVQLESVSEIDKILQNTFDNLVRQNLGEF